LPFIDWTRLEKAEVFHEEIKQGVEAHRTDPEYTHAGYAINPIVGVYQETSQSAVFVNGRVRTLPTYWDDESGEAVDHSGDGRVPRISAVPHEHSLMSGWMATACHAALQNADDVLEQVFFTITGAQIEGVVMRSVTELAGVGLKVTDLFSTDEPIAASIRCEDRSRELEIALEAAEGKQVIESKVVRFGDDEWTSVEFPPQQAGLYRLRVSGAGAQTVEDVFLTLEP